MSEWKGSVQDTDIDIRKEFLKTALMNCDPSNNTNITNLEHEEISELRLQDHNSESVNDIIDIEESSEASLRSTSEDSSNAFDDTMSLVSEEADNCEEIEDDDASSLKSYESSKKQKMDSRQEQNSLSSKENLPYEDDQHEDKLLPLSDEVKDTRKEGVEECQENSSIAAVLKDLAFSRIEIAQSMLDLLSFVDILNNEEMTLSLMYQETKVLDEVVQTPNEMTMTNTSCISSPRMDHIPVSEMINYGEQTSDDSNLLLDSGEQDEVSQGQPRQEEEEESLEVENERHRVTRKQSRLVAPVSQSKAKPDVVAKAKKSHSSRSKKTSSSYSRTAAIEVNAPKKVESVSHHRIVHDPDSDARENEIQSTQEEPIQIISCSSMQRSSTTSKTQHRPQSCCSSAPPHPPSSKKTMEKLLACTAFREDVDYACLPDNVNIEGDHDFWQWSSISCYICTKRCTSRCETCSQYFGVSIGLCEKCFQYEHFCLLIKPISRRTFSSRLNAERKRAGLLPFPYHLLPDHNDLVKGDYWASHSREAADEEDLKSQSKRKQSNATDHSTSQPALKKRRK